MIVIRNGRAETKVPKSNRVFLVLALFLFTFLGGLPKMQAVWAEKAETVQNAELPTKDLRLEAIELSTDEVDRLLSGSEDAKEGVLTKKERLYSATYQSTWDQYSSNYVYNRLPEELKKIWDELDASCLKYLTTQADAQTVKTIDGERKYAIDQISSTSISTTVLNHLGLLFRYCNPQYYFLNDCIYYGTSKSANSVTNVFTIGVYEKFGEGAKRALETAAFFKQVEAARSELSSCKNDYEIALAAHDLVNNRVDYDYSYATDASYNEEETFSQSAYSVFCMDKTVCAGYTLAYELLLNAMGVDCFGVTSLDHAWNKVLLEDNWYNVDCTWDDTEGNYFYFARNDRNITDGSHTPASAWDGYLPSCTLDTYSGYSSAGTLPKVTEMAKQPQVSAVLSDDGYEVTLDTGTKNADIYYTTDGTKPSSASTKSQFYSGGFLVQKRAVIRAVAVADRCKDSKELSVQVSGSGLSDVADTAVETDGSLSSILVPIEDWTDTDASLTDESDADSGFQIPAGSYLITYELDGGENDESNPDFYDGSKKIKLKKPKKTGYRFAGWYTREDLSGSISVIKAGMSGELTLYAKWVPIRYTIAFSGNGSTKGKMSSLVCRYSETYKLLKNKFQRKGYRFAGWNTKANGKGASYKNKEAVMNLASAAGIRVVLYAQWKEK